MHLKWTEHLKDPKDRENFKQMVLGSNKVLDRLREICYNSVNSDDKIKETDYDSPSWSHKQAHKNGKIEAYREIIALLKF